MSKEALVQTLGVLIAVGTIVLTVVALIAVFTGFEPG
jgi:hypothetical protein